MHQNIIDKIEAKGLKVIGICERNGETYIGIKMPELVFTLNSIESFAVNFPVELFEKKYKLTLAHLASIDYDFCRKAEIKPIYMLRRKGVKGFIEQALNRHKPIYLCRDSIWLPVSINVNEALELIEVLKDWYEVRSPKRKGK
ncbi:MAG: hypothetical protein DRJ60_07065 [Thermoprotei archaeon]|nr:MAG: hypothetical protein DRJ60_07065 [Thermoprotei archaeon]